MLIRADLVSIVVSSNVIIIMMMPGIYFDCADSRVVAS